MKNKKALYVLLPVVVVIWGLIIFKVFSYTNEEPEFSPYSKTNIGKDKGEVLQENFVLDLNYEDPFKTKVGIRKTTTAENYKPKIKSNRAIRWPEIKYYGIVRNEKTARKVVSVGIGGRSYLMKEGEEKEKVRLVRVYGDSVLAKFKGEERVLMQGGEK